MKLDFSMEEGGDFRRALRLLETQIAGFGNGTSALARLVVERVGEFETKQNVQTFASEGAKSGATWAALTPAYAKRKQRLRPGRKRLVFDGNLRRSLIAPRDANRIQRAHSGGLLEFGTRHRLARYHQDGTPRMVARPPVRKSPAQVRELQKAIARELVVGLARRTAGAMSLQLARAAGQIKPDPRA